MLHCIDFTLSLSDCLQCPRFQFIEFECVFKDRSKKKKRLDVLIICNKPIWLVECISSLRLWFSSVCWKSGKRRRSREEKRCNLWEFFFCGDGFLPDWKVRFLPRFFEGHWVWYSACQYVVGSLSLAVH